MRIEAISKRIIFSLTINLLVLSGCAVMQKLGGSTSPTDYALGINGATVVASNFTPGHSPSTVINGITSSDGWDDGEGWECPFDRKRPRSGGWSRLDPRTTMGFGAAWLEVQFNGPKLINRVTVHTLDSGKYPASQYGIEYAWLQLWEKYGWTTMAEVENGAIVARDSLRRKQAGGKMVFRFASTETDKIRLVVFRSRDFKLIGGNWTDDAKVERSVARVVEIEATGVGRMSESKAASAKTPLEPAPEFVLQDLDGEWVRLSNFRGKVVVLSFWAEWSSASQRQVRELAKLHSQYKGQVVVVIGISVNEGGAERIRPFVERNNLNYPVLIADTSTKMAYGGIGKLPTSFVIDQEGNIYKKYVEYQGGHIFQLDISKLLPSE